MKHSIKYGGDTIDFILEYAARKTIQIDVCPDLSIVVRAPECADFDKIMEKVEKRAAWIVKQRAYFNQFLPSQPPRKFISGETHRYLGRQCRLKTIKAEERKIVMAAGH